MKNKWVYSYAQVMRFITILGLSAIIFTEILGKTLIKNADIFDQLSYILTFTLILICILNFLFVDKIRQKEKIYSLILLIIFLGIRAFWIHNVVWFALSFAFFAWFLSIRQFIFSYFIGGMLGLIVISILLLFEIVPVSHGGLITLGFSNPNTVGFILFVNIVSAIYLYYSSNEVIVTFAFLIAEFVQYFILQNKTAAILLLLFFIFQLKNKKINLVTFKSKIKTILPIVLLFSSVYMAINYSSSTILQKLNSFLSYRISLWHYYVTNYGFNLLPSNVSDLETRPLDGAFMYYLIYYGWLEVIFIALIICVALRKLRNYKLHLLLIYLLFYAFMESTPFDSSVCYLLPICFYVAEYSIFNRGREYEKSNTEEHLLYLVR